MVARLVDDDPLPRLVSAVKDEIDRQTAGAFDHDGLTEEKYRIVIGYVRGLNWVLQAVEDLAKQVKES